MALDVLGNDYGKLKDKKLFLFDMDGTVYLGNILFDGVKELLDKITQSGGRFMFITNNAARSVKDYVKKVKDMGISVTEEHFFTSVHALLKLLKDKFSNVKIYAQGTKSFIKELKKNNLKIVTKYDENAKCIVVGFDPEFTGKKIENTCKMLGKNLPYYATNPDWVCPTEFGYVPDCGSMCFGIEKATGKAPEFIGKPQPTMIYEAMKICGVEKEETVVIGDRIYTDIASGYNAGVDTVLVLSGEATMDDYNLSKIKPTFVLNHVSEMLK